MKKDAFITSGFLPVPATSGGAVESLVQNLLDENEKENLRYFSVFSIYDEKASNESKKYKNTEFYFYKPNRIIKSADSILYFMLTSILRKEKKMSYKFIIQRLFYLNFVSKKLKENNFNSVIIENNTTLFLALKWRKNYIKYSEKYYFHLHNDIDNFYGCKAIIEKCHRILTVSKYIANIVEHKLNYNPNNIKVLMNCIDMDRFHYQYTASEIVNLKKNIGIPVDDKVIIFVGRTIKEKGILQVLEAFNTLNRKNWTLLIVGSSGFDIKVASDFEKQLYSEAKNNHKIVFTGFIPYSKIEQYYAIADIAILPSVWDEPAGLTMLEAISTGTPLITTNAGGIPEYVQKYGAIVLDRNNLVDNIVDHMIAILDYNVKVNQKLVSQCHKEFNLDIYLSQFVKYIN